MVHAIEDALCGADDVVEVSNICLACFPRRRVWYELDVEVQVFHNLAVGDGVGRVVDGHVDVECVILVIFDEI